MIVIPSVDLMRGQCVQLVGGKPGTGKEYGDPMEISRKWISQGATCLHLIDLDAAIGTGDNTEKILRIIGETNVETEVGGGIRSLERAKELIDGGADRVIIGTAAVENPELVDRLIEKFGGERVMVALDSRSGRVMLRGWQKTAEMTPLELGLEFERRGVGYFLYTNVDVEGRMKGAALDEVRRLTRKIKTPIYASGGIGSLDDIIGLKQAGAAGAVVGMALYEGRFKLKDAMKVAGQ